MWKNIKVLCCPKEPDYTIENSNLGYLDQCDFCDIAIRCRMNIKQYEKDLEEELKDAE